MKYGKGKYKEETNIEKRHTRKNDTEKRNTEKRHIRSGDIRESEIRKKKTQREVIYEKKEGYKIYREGTNMEVDKHEKEII